MARIRTIKPEFWCRDNDVWRHGPGLYVIREFPTGPVKVGLCSHPRRRLTMLQCGNPRELLLMAVWVGTRAECRAIERATHKEFPRIRGEWLNAVPDEVIAFINSEGAQ